MDHSPEFKAITAALRGILKTKKLTHAAVAARLGISAQTVKRLVHGYGDSSLDKLVAVAGVAGVSFYDLVRLAGEPKERTFALSEAQEEFLRDHPAHYAVFNALRDRQTAAAIRAEHDLDLASLRRYLRELDRAGLVERLPGDEARSRFFGAHNLLNDGPLFRYTREEGLRRIHDFLAGPPADPADASLQTHTWSGTMLSRAGVTELIKEVHELAARYRRRAQRENDTLPGKDLVEVEWTFAVAAPFRALPRAKVPRFN
jgi:transcriptional regulator with XRE-family HTH domain